MTRRVPTPKFNDPLRSGLRISIASIAWTIASSTAAVIIGLSGASLSLIAFGATGLLDAIGSIALVMHFRHSLAHEAFSRRHEQFASRIVTSGLVVVGLLTTVESIKRLGAGTITHSGGVGIGIAAVSIVALTGLSHRKRIIAAAIPSGALRADSYLSATGALLAVVTIIGGVITTTLDWWWVDPIAALLIAGAAIGLAFKVATDATDNA